ncbi:hypothetical protein M422DRAFT_267783 [Sphaerobolus stellatus SS14]|uniref:Uncharacterized protein n=1 Tax=Sphaerobolus stellatus (strain SS14) TaxID=990650 RepID=A0A0C9UP06_SPHS4|nr:hypothetical protein M422DRAFT_267783 [Sphaerobolus stellatus SS14]
MGSYSARDASNGWKKVSKERRVKKARTVILAQQAILTGHSAIWENFEPKSNLTAKVKEETVAVTPVAKKVLGLNIRGSTPKRAVSVKVRKGRKQVIITEESEGGDEVYNKPLTIEEAEEADHNVSLGVLYITDAETQVVNNHKFIAKMVNAKKTN